MDDAELRALATKRIKARSDFYHYLWVWLGVSILLTVIWFLTTPGGYFWPAWAIGGMGIAAFFQAISVFGPGGVITDSRIDAEVERLKRG
ncbi:MAG: 2TM domain-containing protein [Rhodoglobus sp.]